MTNCNETCPGEGGVLTREIATDVRPTTDFLYFLHMSIMSYKIKEKMLASTAKIGQNRTFCSKIGQNRKNRTTCKPEYLKT